jgi:hypothetical protein
MVSSYFILYLGIYNDEFFKETQDSNLIGACALTLLFAIFIMNTFFPIKLDLTRDPMSKTYGIHKVV